MYWLSLYLLVVSSSMTLCRISKILQLHLFVWGLFLFLAGLFWYFWQERYGKPEPSRGYAEIRGKWDTL